ncbi:MAG: hypothetical protein QM778_27560 [Myxococcales bacterium]
MAHAESTPSSASPLEASTAPTRLELDSLARSLGSPDRATRRAAFESLRALGPDALPAISARLSALGQATFDHEGVLAAWSSFRKVQGVDAPEAPVDLAQGVLPALEQSRTPGMVLGAELLALLRALEAQKAPDASELIVARLFTLDGKLFRYEAPRVRERLSVLLIPAVIRHQNHLKPSVRSFCQDTLNALGISAPGRAVQQDDVALLAAILEAYGDTLNFDAMPVVVSYITDDRLEVQSAARKAVARFGRNAIWQIRERYLNATGKEADPNWGHQRILNELYRLHAEPKQRAFEAELKRAQAALEDGAFEAASQALDTALRISASTEDHKRAAPLFAALGEHALDTDTLEPALTYFRRALRLDPESAQQPQLRARIAYLEGELRLSQGVLDLTSFERARQLDPAFAPAEAAFDELSGERAAREQRQRQWLGLAAALLMAGAGFTLLRRQGRSEPRTEAEPTTSPLEPELGTPASPD